MTLIRVTYFSRMCLNRTSRSRSIARIVGRSVADNRRNGVTGALIYDDRWFAQILEGAEPALSATFERILRDPRHRDISLVEMRPIARRCLADFAMIGLPRTKDNDGLFRHYGGDGPFDPREMRADRLTDLIEAVVGHRAGGGHPWTTGNVTNVA